MRLALALALVLLAPATAHAEPPAPVPLDSGWELSFDRERWEPTSVPGVFDGTPDPEDFEGRVGFYRLTFPGPEAVDGYDWVLRFETVRRVARVSLNGVRLGGSDEPYLPFALPAGSLRPGAENVLEVRVDGRKGDEPREGWWNWNGIVRPVTLVPRGRVELEHAAVLTKALTPEAATLLFDGWVVNRSDLPASPEIAIAMRAPGGEETRVLEGAGELAPGERRRVTFELGVEDPDPWSPDDPALYDTTIDALLDGNVEQRETLRTGIRTVRVVDGALELNGRPVQLSGASIHEDVEGRGAALTDADIERIVSDLEALGANVTRSHYLLDERLLDRLDEAGILVWSQAPIYHRDRLLETAEQRIAALDTLRGTVLGARAHPSVLTHSVANELSVVPDEVPGTQAYVDAARRLASDLDPTLPPSIDMLSYPGYPRAETYARFPLLGINSYFGWYRGKDDHRVDDLEDLGPYLRRMQRQYPDAAKVVTEFGAEATLDGPADRKQTYAFQAAYVERVLEIVRADPDIGGAIYWTLREFAVKPFWDGGADLEEIRTDSIHNKGLTAYDGERKPAWAVARAEFAATPLYRDGASDPLPGDGGVLGRVLLFGLPAVLLTLLLAMAWAIRDVWRATRPPGGEVVSLPARRAA